VTINGNVVLSEATQVVCPNVPGNAEFHVGFWCAHPNNHFAIRYDDVTFTAK
jgi:hypothetical protein